MTGAALALWISSIAGTTPPPAPEAEHAATPVENAREPARFRAALETSAMSFPSGPAGGGQDVFLVPSPVLSFEGGGDFALALGAPFRLRVFDDPPSQRDRDYRGILRAEDWDELSDVGQLLRELRIGAEDAAFALRIGAFTSYTLGSGQLISRYSNRVSPNHHPAGARAVIFAGPTRSEVFVSDIFGARIFAAEVALDAGRAFGDETYADRYHLSLSAVHDVSVAGGRTAPITLGWFEGSAALLRAERVRMATYLGLGARAFDDGSSVGATLGLAMEGEPTGWRIGGRAEVRKLNGHFRPGIIGYDYELARFAAVGLGLGNAPTGTTVDYDDSDPEAPLARNELPNAFSFRGELSIGFGGDDPESQLLPGMILSVAAEHFTFGRDDLDVALSGRALDGKGALGVRAAISGIGLAPRFVLSIESRYRFAPSFYALASGGTVFCPQPDGGLARGYHAGIGVGMDFER